MNLKNLSEIITCPDCNRAAYNTKQDRCNYCGSEGIVGHWKEIEDRNKTRKSRKIEKFREVRT